MDTCMNLWGLSKFQLFLFYERVQGVHSVHKVFIETFYLDSDLRRDNMNLYVQGVQSVYKVWITESIWIQKYLEKKSERFYLQGVHDLVFQLRILGGIVEVTYRVAIA